MAIEEEAPFNDTFTMKDIDTLQPEAAVAEKAPDEKTPEPPTNPEDKPSNFIENFQKAKKGEDVAPEKEPPKEEEAVSEEESRSAKDFKQIKEERDQAKQQIAEMEAKLSNLKDNNVDEVLETLKAERDVLSERLKATAIEKHPDFIRQFDDKIAQVVGNAKKTVGEHNEERVERLLRMEDSSLRDDGIEALFDELSPAKKHKMGAMLAQVDTIRSERAAMLTNQEESFKQLNAQHEADVAAQTVESSRVFDEALAEATKHVEVFQKKDGEDGWNQGIEDMVSSAKNIFSGNNGDLNEVARATLWAAAAPRYRQMLAESYAENQKLKAQLSGAGSSNPTLSKSPEGEAGSEPKSFMETFGEVTGMDMTP